MRFLRSIFVVLCMLQFSGVLHVIVDAVGAEEHEDECSEGECPPGCVGCHHVHNNLYIARVTTVTDAPNEKPNVAFEATVVPEPEQPMLYRPPICLFV